MRSRVSFIMAGLVLGIAVLDRLASAQTSPPQVPREYVFTSGAGALFFHVRPDRTTDFENIVGSLGTVLERSTDPVRRQQASSWRVYKSAESPRDAVIYVFFFDPAVPSADYDPVAVLTEALPADARGLYDRLRADVIRIERMGLTKLR